VEHNAPAPFEGEPNATTVVVVIEGGYRTLKAACEAVEADIPVLVFAGSGKAADFIAAAYDRRDKPLVLHTITYHSCDQLPYQCRCIVSVTRLQYIARQVPVQCI